MRTVQMKDKVNVLVVICERRIFDEELVLEARAAAALHCHPQIELLLIIRAVLRL